MDDRLKVVLGCIGGLLLAWAVADQLMRPADLRTWHGRLGGIVPYDLRPPSFDRLQAAYWDPNNPHLFTGKSFGVGWGINLPVLLGLVRRVQGSRS